MALQMFVVEVLFHRMEKNMHLKDTVVGDRRRANMKDVKYHFPFPSLASRQYISIWSTLGSGPKMGSHEMSESNLSCLICGEILINEIQTPK